MRRLVALLTLAALSWSHLVAFRCDMGAATDPAAHHESGFASAHHAAVADHAAASAQGPATHADPSAGESSAPGPSSPSGHGDHGDAAGCVMALPCGAASAFAAQAAGITRLPALFVLPDFRTAPIPLAAAPAVETPPPRRTV